MLGVLTHTQGWKLGRLGPFRTLRGHRASAAVLQGRLGTYPKFSAYPKMALCMHMTHTAQDAMGLKNHSRIDFRNPQGQFDNF